MKTIFTVLNFSNWILLWQIGSGVVNFSPQGQKLDSRYEILTPRLVVCILIVVISLALSGVTFYYFHIKAPIIPLLVGLLGALPMGIIIDEVRHLLLKPELQ